MLNSQKSSKDNGSNSAITESLSLQNKNDNKEEVELKNTSTRKYHLRNVFRHFVCCSCFPNDDGNKYTVSKNDKEVGKSSFDNKKDKKDKNITADITDTGVNPLNNGENNKSMSLNSDPISSKSKDGMGETTETVILECRSGDTYEICDQNIKLLPEATEQNRHKKCFVIDLDETLVHSSYGYVKTADIHVTVDIDGVQQKVYVCKRPFVDEFIAEVGELFECVLFTASLGKYADPVTDFLDPEKKVFESRLFREACSFRDGNYVKDLDILGRVTDDVLILDNSPVSYWQHPQNAIQIISWFDDPSDTALRDLLPYLRELASSSLSVVDFLSQQEPPSDSVGLLGYPPSNLHWLLAQYHSVALATSIYQQQQQHQEHHNFVSSDEEDEDDEEQVVEKRTDSDEIVTTHIDNEVIPSVVVSSEVETSTIAAENISRHNLIRQSLPDQNQNQDKHSFITQALKDYRRKSQAALEDEIHRPPVSSPVARPKSEFHMTDDSGSVSTVGAGDICHSAATTNNHKTNGSFTDEQKEDKL